jgi:hypothetical protein
MLVLASHPGARALQISVHPQVFAAPIGVAVSSAPLVIGGLLARRILPEASCPSHIGAKHAAAYSRAAWHGDGTVCHQPMWAG